MARIGNRTRPGHYVLSSWKNLETTDSATYLEQRAMATDRMGIVRCVYRAGSDFPEHFHPQQQVTIVEEGSLEITIKGERIVVRQGEMVSIEPLIPHSTRVAEGYERTVALNIFLRDRALKPSGTPRKNGNGVVTILTAHSAVPERDIA